MSDPLKKRECVQHRNMRAFLVKAAFGAKYSNASIDVASTERLMRTTMMTVTVTVMMGERKVSVYVLTIRSAN